MKLRIGVKRSWVIALATAAVAGVLYTQVAAAADYHTVQYGETLSEIAISYGVSETDIMAENGITNPDLIVTGQELYIPTAGEGAMPTPAQGGGNPVYIVVAGDSLPSIAAEFGVMPGDLAESNNLEYPWPIYPGDELVVPGMMPTEVVYEAPDYGDALLPDVAYLEPWYIRSMLVDAAQMYGWDPYMILSLAWRESMWDQRVISYAGAIGVMQLMPETAAWAGPALTGHEIDYVYSAWDNIETGVAYLTHLRNETGSDYLALASYYQGMYSVEHDGVFEETREYALDIIQKRDLFATGQLP